jgi:predicted hydrocarbon binding protein
MSVRSGLFGVSMYIAEGNGMAERNEGMDFERTWLETFSRSIEAAAGEEARRRVMEGSGELNSDSPPARIVEWSRAAIGRLESQAGTERAREIMTRCACRYPAEELREIRRLYAETGDLDRAIGMLRAGFESFLRETLRLSADGAQDILARGWGPAGVREGGRIVATKIPKSENLEAYLRESDPRKKREYYCHCPRVRAAVRMGERIPGIYCYCGAGFYRGIWEEILQRPVKVEVLESVLQGGELCRVAVILPEGTWRRAAP